MKLLNVVYHSQRNNKLFPYSTCGTTCVAGYLDWLDASWKKTYQSDDDKVFVALNSEEMLERMDWMSKNGYSYVQDYINKVRILDGKETDYTHLNNLFIALMEVGSYLTNHEFEFKIQYLPINDIKECIDEGYPLIMAGAYPGTSGHYILCIGYDDKNNLICNDPYGDFKTEYKNNNGAKVVYSFKDIWAYGKKMTDSDGCMLVGRAYYKGNILMPNAPTKPVNPSGNPWNV